MGKKCPWHFVCLLELLASRSSKMFNFVLQIFVSEQKHNDPNSYTLSPDYRAFVWLAFEQFLQETVWRQGPTILNYIVLPVKHCLLLKQVFLQWEQLLETLQPAEAEGQSESQKSPAVSGSRRETSTCCGILGFGSARWWHFNLTKTCFLNLQK